MEVMSIDGRNAASFLHGPFRLKQSQSEYIELLASHFFSQFNARDTLGWTALHRAAAWGTSSDINALLRMGTHQSLRTHRLSWMPLTCAVAYRNIETVHALWNDSSNPTDEKGARGWNLLHIAVAYDNFEVIPYLLRKGVELNSKSMSTTCRVPSLVMGKSVTPGELAGAFGEAAYNKWVGALTMMGSAEETVPADTELDVYGSEPFGECECCDNWIVE